MALSQNFAGWPTLVFTMAPEPARSVKSSLRLLIICNLNGLESLLPPIDSATTAGNLRRATGYAETTPTFQLPKAKITYQFALIADVLSFIVFDQSTGGIVAKFDRRGKAGELNGSHAQ